MSRRTPKQNKTRAKARKSTPIWLKAVLVSVFVAFVFLGVSMYGLRSSNSTIATPRIAQQVHYNLTNLNLTDVKQNVHGANYTAYRLNNMTAFNKSLLNPYLATSVSVFNITKGNLNSTKQSAYPYSIISGVTLMNSTGFANSAVGSFLFSNNANQTIVRSNSTMNYTTYAYGNSIIDIYEVYSVAVYNISYIQPGKLSLPDYQYVTVFAYKNMVCTVITNSYNPGLNKSIAVRLSEVLFNKLNTIK